MAIGALAVVGLASIASAAITPSSVGPNVMVNARGAGQNVEDFKSPSVAIDPGNANRVVIASRADRPDFSCQIQHSSNGGASWSSSSFPPPPKGTCWSPSAAWDASGNVYVAAQNRPPRGGDQDIIVWKSSDGGQTFAAPVVIPGSTGSSSFQAGIAVDTRDGSPFKGRIYVAWYQFPNFPASIDTLMSFSDDGGATWSTPTSRPVVGQYQQFPQPAVAPDGTVYVVFKDTFSTPADGCRGGTGSFGDPTAGAECEIRVLRSSNGGASFDADPFTVATANFNDLSVAEQPGIAISPSGTVLVSFSSIPTPTAPGCSRDQDVFAARSTDRGANWSSPIRLNDDPCASGATQRNPWISVAPNGRVDTIFYDNRDDSTDPRDRYGVRYANSTDGGLSFGSNPRVSDVDFDATTFFAPRSQGFQSNEFDQVNGIDSTDTGAVGAWGDSRQAPSSTSTRSDVFSVGIGFAEPGPGPGPAPGPGPGPGGPGGGGLPAFGGCPILTANVIRGTAASNTITGTPAADRIFAGTGDDVVDALAGSDCVDLGTGDDRGQGGFGDDLIVGGLGADRISGSSGNDRLRGNGANDRIDAGRGNDRAFGDAGNDVIRGSFGNDRLHGVSGNDRIGGSRGRDRINGGSGRDLIAAGSSNDRVSGDRGNDRINGNSGNDVLKGNSGKDRIVGGTGRDVVSGGSGSDRIDVRDGKRDRVNCGRGRDTVIADPKDRVSDNCERVVRRRV
jgi:Ca2+-binding RTX toxin-like protein